MDGGRYLFGREWFRGKALKLVGENFVRRSYTLAAQALVLSHGIEPGPQEAGATGAAMAAWGGKTVELMPGRV